MKTQAAVLVQLKQPLEIVELEIPALSCGQVLVRVICSGVCGSQLGEIDGAKGPDPYLPHLLGHEGCAEVLEVGPGVGRVKAGDRVVLHWRKASGIEAAPAQYASARGPVNSGWVVSLARHAVVSENRLTPVSLSTPPEVAALLGCAITTGMGVINNDARLTVGESLLILGAGGVGLSVIQAARMAGAFPIVAVDRFENRLSLAREMGADHALHSSTDNIEEILRSLAPAKGYDIAIESTGLVSLIETAYRLTQPQGRVILVGVPRAGEKATIHTLPLHFGKVLTGSHGGSAQPEQDIPRYLRLFEAGRLPVQRLVSRHYPLDEVNRAITDMRNGELAGRCIIDMDHS